MVAVGTFDPDIEVWDLDLVESVYPDAILGKGADKGKEEKNVEGTEEGGKKKKKKKKKKKSVRVNEKFHVDAVMSLSANRLQRNLLLSGSADSTVKLWDLTSGSSSSCVQSYGFHKDKVSAVQWHPKEAFYALTGSYDRTINAGDFRTANGKGAKWTFTSDIEGLKWDPHDSNLFYVPKPFFPHNPLIYSQVSTDDGILHNYDIRTHSSTTQTPLWLLQAHDETLSTFDISPTHPGLIVTGSVDKLVKLWHVTPSGGPNLVLSRDLDLGKIFSVQFGVDDDVAMRVAVAGSSASVKVWDLTTSLAARRAFGVVGRGKESVEDGKVVGVTEVEDEKDDDEEEEGDVWENMDDN